MKRTRHSCPCGCPERIKASSLMCAVSWRRVPLELRKLNKAAGRAFKASPTPSNDRQLLRSVIAVLRGLPSLPDEWQQALRDYEALVTKLTREAREGV